MLSQTTEYALRAIVCLAQYRHEPMTGKRMAEITGLPASYLAKILEDLARTGLITSRRGRRGGFALAVSTVEMTVLDVVNAVDPLRRIERCPLGKPEHMFELCPLHRQIDDAVALVESTFASCTIDSLLAQPEPGVPMCTFPRVTLHKNGA